MKQFIKRWLLLALLILLLIIFFHFHGYQYLSFDSLKMHRQILLTWTHQHFTWMILGYMLIYIIAVACSIPGATFLTLAGGFLFGIILGTTLTVISATLGAYIAFMAVKLALHDWFQRRVSIWISKMTQGFKSNAFSYLLVLRLVPLFPFWLVNIVPALLGVSQRIFLITTFLGIIPGSLVYVMIGNGLGHIFDANQTPNLHIIFEPQVLIPLLALAALSLLPLLYKRKKS